MSSLQHYHEIIKLALIRHLQTGRLSVLTLMIHPHEAFTFSRSIDGDIREYVETDSYHFADSAFCSMFDALGGNDTLLSGFFKVEHYQENQELIARFSAIGLSTIAEKE